MVTLERDMQQMRELLVACRSRNGYQKLPPLGACDRNARRCADRRAKSQGTPISLSVGTNDLTQYTLVAGRDDATVSGYYEDTHPSMLRLLGIIIAKLRGSPVTICGEMAGREESFQCC